MREEFAKTLLDCGKLALTVLLASSLFKGNDGEINVLLVSIITFLLFLTGFLFVFFSERR
jgi:hypothetical protein